MAKEYILIAPLYSGAKNKATIPKFLPTVLVIYKKSNNQKTNKTWLRFKCKISNWNGKKYNILLKTLLCDLLSDIGLALDKLISKRKKLKKV